MRLRNWLEAAAAALCATATSASMAALVSAGALSPTEDLFTNPVAQSNTQGAGSTPLYGYAAVGSPAARSAFLHNDQWYLNGGVAHMASVHFAALDSAPLTAAEFAAYSASLVAAAAGKLIQVPVAAVPVAMAFNKSGVSSLNLTPAQLCGVFGGSITDWNQLDATVSGPISVVFRSDGDSSTEILTRHLESVCGSQVFATSRLFAVAHVGPEPSNWVAVAGSAGARAAIDAADGRIGYVDAAFIADEPVAGLYNRYEVAGPARRPDGNGDGALAAQSVFVAPGNAVDRANPVRWVQPSGDPQRGYPVIGTISMLMGQCYNASVDYANAQLVMREFFDRSNSRYPLVWAATGAIGVPLPDAFADAIMASFIVGNGENLQLGLSSHPRCGGMGR